MPPKKKSPNKKPLKKAGTKVEKKPPKTTKVPFSTQIHVDQQKYSRYVCDSRAIPQEVDGLKPVQRRILWAMWNSKSRNNFTKTVKVAGLAMGYHPHGDKSIQDAISAMTQNFSFANNYPLIEGEGTFGDVLDPSAIASPRYTEVRLSPFSKDVGLFESLPDIDYVPNYDETEEEPTFFFGKIPVVLLNNIIGIATGFRCNIPGHKLSDIVDSMISFLKTNKTKALHPWYKGYNGRITLSENANGDPIVSTSFAFKMIDGKVFMTDAPQTWNRNKVIDYLEAIIADKESILRDYSEFSKDKYNIELIFKRVVKPSVKLANELFSKVNNETTAYNVITKEGTLQYHNPDSIIKRFCKFRKEHLIRRFKRLALLEQEKIDKNSELIRFIKEGWNNKVTKIKSKSDFEKDLKKNKFVYFEWLASIPVYRMTIHEVAKCKEAIVEAKKQYAYFVKLYSQNKALIGFIVNEITELKNKYDA